MTGPSRGDVVVLVIPQRERVNARVEEHEGDRYSLYLLQEPRTPMPVLARTRVFMQFAGSDGIGRILGCVKRDGIHGLCFTRQAPAQLLRRAEALNVRASVPITLLRVDAADHVAHNARTIEVGAGGLKLYGVPGAAAGQLYQFDLYLREDEPAVRGQFRVHGVAPDGTVSTRLTVITALERSRLVHYANDHQPRAA